MSLKALRILKDIKISKDGLSLELHPNCVNDDIELAIEELEQYEQKFKDKEFKYRTECQNIVSAARLEADEIVKGGFNKGGFIDTEKFIEANKRIIETLESHSSIYKIAGYESDGTE